VDFLGAGLLAAAVFAGVGWTLDRRPGLR